MLLPIALLFLAVTNLANLVLSRGVSRRRELAVRRALGASRWLLVRDQLIELSILAGLALAASWVTADVGLALLDRFVTSTFGFAPQFRLDLSLAAPSMRLSLTLACGCIFVAGLVPAIELTRREASMSIAPASAVPATTWRGRAYLIAMQVALSMALLLTAGLSVHEIWSQTQLQGSTVHWDRIAAVKVPLSLESGDDAVNRTVLAHILQSAPSVEGTHTPVAVSGLPGVDDCCATVFLPGDTAREPLRGRTGILAGTPGILGAIGIPLVAGRDIEARDDAGADSVVVMNDRLARRVLGTTDVVGRRLLLVRRNVLGKSQEDMVTIIGVTGDVVSPRSLLAVDEIFVPIAQAFEPDLVLLARTERPQEIATLARGLTAAARHALPGLAIGYEGRADIMVGAPLLTRRLVAEGAVLLALVGLGLTMAGLYGVLSNLVARRRTEMGVRLALGATPMNIVRLIVIDGAKPVVGGLLAGAAFAAIVRLSTQPLMSSAVTAVDLRGSLTAAIPLVIAAAVACYLPARRASRTDPIIALRDN